MSWLLNQLAGIKNAPIAQALVNLVPGAATIVNEIDTVQGLIPAKQTTTVTLDPTVVAAIQGVEQTILSAFNAALTEAGATPVEEQAFDAKMEAAFAGALNVPPPSIPAPTP